MIATLLLALFSCSSDPNQGRLAENVGASFAPCNEAEIRFLSTKHNFMPAFRPCGNNHFSDSAWSPDGRSLYFQLGMAHHVMNAESATKDTLVVPTTSPMGTAAWLSATRLVVPVGPAIDAPEGSALRLAQYDTEQATIFYVDLPVGWTEIKDLQRGDVAGTVLLTALASEQRHVWRVDLADGKATQPFSWAGPVTSMTYTPEQAALVLGIDGGVGVYDAETGTRRGHWAPASRGSLHHDGRWLMLEHLGDPVSIFYQRAWDELSEQARERELRRAERFSQGLPDTFPTEVRPPTLSFVDVLDGRRWLLSSIYGSDFEWYHPTDFYGSLMFWGYEGKQFKRNVMLGDFGNRMRSATSDRDFMGVTLFEGDATPAPSPHAAPEPPATDAP